MKHEEGCTCEQCSLKAEHGRLYDEHRRASDSGSVPNAAALKKRIRQILGGLDTDEGRVGKLMILFMASALPQERSTNSLASIPEVAQKILAVRDALVEGDPDEAFHQLYSIASPYFDKYEPWQELEKIAKTLSQEDHVDSATLAEALRKFCEEYRMNQEGYTLVRLKEAMAELYKISTAQKKVPSYLERIINRIDDSIDATRKSCGANFTGLIEARNIILQETRL